VPDPAGIGDIGKAMDLAMTAEGTLGAQVLNELMMVERSRNLFVRNAFVLRKTLDHLQDPAVWMVPPPPGKTEFEDLDEIDRLMHNFLASAYTLATHTMKARKVVTGDDFAREYNEHSPWADPVCKIVEAVRNDVQHAHLAGVESYAIAKLIPDPGAQPFEFRFRLVRKYLVTLDVNAKTKKYIEELREDPSLDDLIDRYASLVVEFVNWFGHAVLEHMADEVALTTTIRAAAQQIAGPVQLRIRHFGR
jgi:hypothetical protein